MPVAPDDDQGRAFFEWLIVQPDDALQLDIIRLRDAYEADIRVD